MSKSRKCFKQNALKIQKLNQGAGFLKKTASYHLKTFRGITMVLKLRGVYIFMPDEGRGFKVAKGVDKIVHRILGKFKVIIQIRVGLPLIFKHRKE